MILFDLYGDVVKVLLFLLGVDVLIYGWCGDNIGFYGSIVGYVDFWIIVFIGEEIFVVFFFKDCYLFKGIVMVVLYVLIDIIFNDFNFMVVGIIVNGIICISLCVLIIGIMVYGMMVLMNSLCDEKMYILFFGVCVFIGLGVGVVDEKIIVSVIVVIVLVQDVVIVVYCFVYKNFVKDMVKSWEYILGQIFNEVLLFFLGELGWLLFNYGIQFCMGLLCGNQNDIYSFFGVVMVFIGIEFLCGCLGDLQNYLLFSVIYKVMDFFVVDLVFCLLGVVYGVLLFVVSVSGVVVGYGDMGCNYLEVFVMCFGVCGVDKVLLLIFFIVFVGVGLVGCFVCVGEDQLVWENSFNNLLVWVCDLFNVFLVEIECMFE